MSRCSVCGQKYTGDHECPEGPSGSDTASADQSSEAQKTESSDPPEIKDVVDMELKQESDKRWIVLYDEDYQDLLIDADDSVALLLDNNQAIELLDLASEVVAALAPQYAPDKSPREAMIEQLQEVAADE